MLELYHNFFQKGNSEMNNLILNSVQTIESDAPLAVQLAPFGEFKGVMNMPGGKHKPFVQQLDQAAFERILSAWNAKGSPEILVDADHGSCNQDGSTRAYAWASNLRVVTGDGQGAGSPETPSVPGLYADLRFTDEGAKIVNAREYRFVSPVFNVGENGAILALDSIALTNRPNLPVSCVLNSSESGVTTVEEGKDPEMDEMFQSTPAHCGRLSAASSMRMRCLFQFTPARGGRRRRDMYKSHKVGFQFTPRSDVRRVG